MTIALALELYLILVALLCGSFINLAADRIPRGESLLWPRSHCRGCDRRLNAVDLLPVAGYLVRGGRCATCRAPIGLDAPLVEAVAGVLMLVALIWLGVWRGFAVGLVLLGWLGFVVVSLSVRRRRRVAEV